MPCSQRLGCKPRQKTAVGQRQRVQWDCTPRAWGPAGVGQDRARTRAIRAIDERDSLLTLALKERTPCTTLQHTALPLPNAPQPILKSLAGLALPTHDSARPVRTSASVSALRGAARRPWQSARSGSWTSCASSSITRSRAVADSLIRAIGVSANRRLGPRQFPRVGLRAAECEVAFDRHLAMRVLLAQAAPATLRKALRLRYPKPPGHAVLVSAVRLLLASDHGCDLPFGVGCLDGGRSAADEREVGVLLGVHG